MTNTFITPTIIAREALIALENNLVLGGLVYRDYSDQFAKVGDTVNVRKPASFTAAEFTTETSAQAITESSVAVKLDTIPDVSFEVTSQELSLDIVDFTQQLIVPAARALAQKVDELIAARYVDLPYFVDSATTPGIADIASIGKVLNQNKAPMTDRYLVVGPEAHADYITLDAILHAEKSGSTDALRNASMGRVLGLDAYMDQNMVSHTAGAGTVKIDLSAGYEAGDDDIHVDGVTTALKVGDIITIAGNPYTVTVAGTLATADQDISIYPALKADVANDVDVTVHATHTANMAFHRNCIALVTRPLAKPIGGAESDVVSYGGLSIRATFGYTMSTKKNLVSLDLLCGVKTLCPELGVRFCS